MTMGMARQLQRFCLNSAGLSCWPCLVMPLVLARASSSAKVAMMTMSGDGRPVGFFGLLARPLDFRRLSRPCRWRCGGVSPSAPGALWLRTSNGSDMGVDVAGCGVGCPDSFPSVIAASSSGVARGLSWEADVASRKSGKVVRVAVAGVDSEPQLVPWAEDAPESMSGTDELRGEPPNGDCRSRASRSPAFVRGLSVWAQSERMNSASPGRVRRRNSTVPEFIPR
ncbi:hypothetical protein JOF47_000510 [Paeniglutamicibacter kerguelensis]|uniref:Secreted protein n=1 Tax=Paeniglutamicibacter kerguelensis TaxID=254788 RepID=A0ABS4XBC2_9MICC|nr:hypothetical protein [Paeniglutamicibacter kerguelensis]